MCLDSFSFPPFFSLLPSFLYLSLSSFFVPVLFTERTILSHLSPLNSCPCPSALSLFQRSVNYICVGLFLGSPLKSGISPFPTNLWFSWTVSPIGFPSQMFGMREVTSPVQVPRVGAWCRAQNPHSSGGSSLVVICRLPRWGSGFW